ncbi:MAG: hypothetical protein Q9226_007320 [Calogaya cf. arnoldii]
MGHLISLEDERRITDDFAFLAATEERAEAVTAVAIEVQIEPPGMTVRFAANNGVPDRIWKPIQDILTFISSSIASESSREECLSGLFHLVAKLNRNRIHARIRSKYLYIDPLYEGLRKLLPQLQKVPTFQPFIGSVTRLCNDYESIDTQINKGFEAFDLLQNTVKQSYKLYRAIENALGNTAVDHSSGRALSLEKYRHNKHVQQINKIGRYWALSRFLTKAVFRYPNVFSHLIAERICPYTPTQSCISVNPRTPIVDCFVHAEIQLAIFYDSYELQECQKPRVLGVSKDACYLCQLFIEYHEKFNVSKAHGRIYDQWTLPDLAGFTTVQRQSYRRIIQAIQRTCKAVALEEKKDSQRDYPLTSTLDFGEYKSLPSNASSTLTATPAYGVTPWPFVSDVQPYDSGQTAEEHTGPAGVDAQVSPTSNVDHPSQSQNLDRSSPARASVPIEEPSQGGRISPCCQNPDETTKYQKQPDNNSWPIRTAESEDSTQFPIERIITHKTPFRMASHGMLIYFEMDAPTKGYIKVATAPGGSEAFADIIDVQSLRPGDVIDLYRDGIEPIINVGLCGQPGQHLNIDLRWLAD